MADNVQHKTRLLQHFIKNGNIYKAIIFSATKINADRLTKQLHGEGHSVAALHGDLKQNVRNRTIEAMRRGKIQFLIATDVAARGIDIHDVTHVINFDLPKFHEDYVHRIGRTGRAGKSGIAISFALPDDGRHLQGIERYIGEKLVLSSVSGLEASKSFNFNAAKKKQGRRSGGSGKPNYNSRAFKGGAPKRESFGAKSSSFREDDKARRTRSRGDNAERHGARDQEKGQAFRSSKPKKSSGFKDNNTNRDDFKGKRAAKSSSFKKDNFRSEKPKKTFKERYSR